MGENKMNVIVSSTIRGIVNLSNERCIKKEDIVSLVKEGNQYVLIYFK